MSDKRVVIIGGGVGGLATACLLGKAGYAVTVLEKNEQMGGRAGTFSSRGFRFDTGPSWLLMSDIFAHFFTLMNERMEDHLALVKLSPHYRVFYENTTEHLDITGNLDTDAATFERLEPGAGEQLRRYLKKAAYTYDVSIKRFLYKNYDHLGDFMTPEVIRASTKLALFSTMDRYTRKFFTDSRLQKIVQYPSVFLGASPFAAPALYTLMSHADLTQDIFYPMGGMYKLVEALVAMGKKHGVTHKTGTNVEKILVQNDTAAGVQVGGKVIAADIVVSNADMHFTETVLLGAEHRDHSARYWKSRTLAPSALLLYLGVNRHYPSLKHHNLLFSDDWRGNFAEIFGSRTFPTNPSLYVCAPSKTDPTTAPKGAENLFVLVPISAGLTYSKAELRAFTDQILLTLEEELQLPELRRHIVFQKRFCVADFAEHYNSFQGTGLGLSHTLKQTAIFRPSNKSKKVRGLYYAGAGVHPGIGLPTALISAELVYKRLTGDRSAQPLKSL